MLWATMVLSAHRHILAALNEGFISRAESFTDTGINILMDNNFFSEEQINVASANASAGFDVASRIREAAQQFMNSSNTLQTQMPPSD